MGWRDDEVVAGGSWEQDQRTDQPAYTKGESFRAGVASGATFGFKDELEGITKAIAARLGMIEDADDEASFTEQYRRYRDADRAEQQGKREANPISYGAGDVAGTFVTGAGAGGLARLAARGGMRLATAGVRSVPTVAGRVGQVAGQGAAYGAARGAGEAEELSDIPEEAAKGAAFGAVAAPVAGAAAQGIGTAASKIGGTVVDVARATGRAIPGVSKAVEALPQPVRNVVEPLSSAGIADIIFGGGTATTALTAGTAAKYGGRALAGVGKAMLGERILSGKYGQVLQEAAQSGGANAVAATHYVLWSQDPEYREEVQRLQQGDE